ncbi:hypothetical protein COX75_02555 [bacterium (Candidatus Gribaldobacteria) CG_4_10_14_0_2_um_filter_33_15]|nr:MAG: hypothetical protein COX75_02555 [bacterium (Candidatus Gribaldobacteria) CG_4_10_14_0_2_um_filter_33_15]PJB08857.1 MAG: hypothetical protein CO122_00700 [bacterium (Candidatus Gribaldobacteria) CG_4_9_14_3_um_filter_33_9]
MKEHGFTLFEVLIVIVILAIVFYLGIINFISHQRNIVLDSTAKEIAAYLEQAQNKSIARENDKNWGVYFKNGDTDFLELYSTDSNYAGGATSTIVFLPSGIEFSEPAEGASKEIQFEKLTGKTTSTGIKLKTKGTDKVLDISINNEGKIKLTQCPCPGFNKTLTAKADWDAGPLPQDSNIVGFYQLEEGDGTNVVDQKGTNNLVGTGGITYQQSGKVDYCFDFDGSTGFSYKDSGVSGIGGSSGFTISVWVKRDAINDYYAIWYLGTAGVQSHYLQFFNNNTIHFVIDAGASGYRRKITTNSFSDTANWYHIVAVYNAGDIKIYVNGTEEPGTTDRAYTGNVPVINDHLRIANRYQSGGINNYFFNGKIDELILWNTALTPDKVSTLYTNGSPTRDTYTFSYSNTEGAGSPGDVLLTSSNGSLLLDGDEDYVTSLDSDDWYFGTGDFTVDFWVRYAALPDFDFYVDQYQTSGDFWQLYRYGSSIVMWFRFGSIDKGYYYATNWTPNLNQWYHLEFARSGSNAYIFINGISQTLTVNTSFSTNDVGNLAAPLYIGSQYGTQGYLNGRIDELRVSKGFCRHTVNFDTPTSEYSTDSYTKLLMHMIGIDGAISTTDDSGQGHSFTFYNNAQINRAIVKFSYITSGTHTSQILDLTGTPSINGTFIITETEPNANHYINYEQRHGNTTFPDSTWSSWASIANNGTLPGEYRYWQIKSSFYGNGNNTPFLQEYQLNWPTF